jgi:4-hydroxy-tetrahydrodipicolinate synthase
VAAGALVAGDGGGIGMLVTALWTPFREGGVRLDLELVERLVAFQLQSGSHQVLLGGTTGEGASLAEDERLSLLDTALAVAQPRQLMFSIGGGRLPDVIARGRAALERGVRDLLLADAPYAGASSAALRECWHGPVAAALPEARLLPYAIPSRTGTELLPDDLARLAEQHANVVGVKDATGRLARMIRVRELCGADFRLLVGDDGHLRDAMLDPSIRADGACSVASNLVPAAVRSLVDRCRAGEAAAARVLHDRLAGLFGLAAVNCEERVTVGGRVLAVPQRSRNPVPLKAALALLGLGEETCRPPLSVLGQNARTHVREVLRAELERQPSLLAPLAERFGLDLPARLASAGQLVHGG